MLHRWIVASIVAIGVTAAAVGPTRAQGIVVAGPGWGGPVYTETYVVVRTRSPYYAASYYYPAPTYPVAPSSYYGGYYAPYTYPAPSYYPQYGAAAPYYGGYSYPSGGYYPASYNNNPFSGVYYDVYPSAGGYDPNYYNPAYGYPAQYRPLPPYPVNYRSSYHPGYNAWPYRGW